VKEVASSARTRPAGRVVRRPPYGPSVMDGGEADGVPRASKAARPVEGHPPTTSAELACVSAHEPAELEECSRHREGVGAPKPTGIVGPSGSHRRFSNIGTWMQTVGAQMAACLDGRDGATVSLVCRRQPNCGPPGRACPPARSDDISSNRRKICSGQGLSCFCARPTLGRPPDHQATSASDQVLALSSHSGSGRRSASVMEAFQPGGKLVETRRDPASGLRQRRR